MAGFHSLVMLTLCFSSLQEHLTTCPKYPVVCDPNPGCGDLLVNIACNYLTIATWHGGMKCTVSAQSQ